MFNVRYRSVTTSALVQAASGENVVSLVPFVMPRSVAQATASRQKAFGATSKKRMPELTVGEPAAR